MTNEERMSRIAERFPSLRHADGVRPWDARKLALWIVSGRSHGEQVAGRFMLAVWNGGTKWPWDDPTISELGKVHGRHVKIRPFDLFEARAVWDAEHEKAFKAWALADYEFTP